MQISNNIPRILPFAIYISLLAFGAIFTELLANTWLNASWLYAIRALVVSGILVFFWKSYSELHAVLHWMNVHRSHYILPFIAGVFVFLIWIIPYPSWLTMESSTMVANPVNGFGTTAAMLWLSCRVLGSALLVPVMEELFWRSFLMRWLDSQKVDNLNFLSISPASVSQYALVISSCLFALEHQLWFAGLIAGLAYGQLYRHTQNLWMPIFAHVLTNGLLSIWVMTTGEWHYW